jgi:hypothetical protein
VSLPPLILKANRSLPRYLKTVDTDAALFFSDAEELLKTTFFVGVDYERKK